MTNRNLFLLLGTSLSFLPQALSAQCVSPIQDCYALGYTQSSCPSGKGVKCPFGNGWYCGGTAAQDCLKLGYDKDCTGAGESGSGATCNGKYQSCTCDSSYQYTCSGTGYSGGSGTACGGKYTKCTCASGYEWKDGSCQKKEVLNGADGDVYKCNGVVVGVKTSGMDFYVAMNDLGQMTWSSGNNACQNYSFCGNLKGTLPTKDQLITIYNNKSTLEALLTSNGGNKFSTDTYYWSSTITTTDYYYHINMLNGSVNYIWNGYGSFNIRPVLSSY